MLSSTPLLLLLALLACGTNADTDTARYQTCPNATCVGTACFKQSNGQEGYYLPCVNCRCIDAADMWPAAPACDLSRLDPSWIWRAGRRMSLALPAQCNSTFFNTTTAWAALDRRSSATTKPRVDNNGGRWIALIGDSRMRSVFVSLVAVLAGPGANMSALANFNGVLYHRDHVVCCDAPGRCEGIVRTGGDIVPTTLVEMVGRRLWGRSWAVCVTWQWNKFADGDLVAAVRALADASRPPVLVTANPGIHGLVPNRLDRELDGVERLLKLCQAKHHRTRCVMQTTAHTGYNATDAETHGHIRLRQYVAAYNAGVRELLAMYPGAAELLDLGTLSRLARVRATMSGDRLHYLHYPATLSIVAAQQLLNMAVGRGA